MSRLSTFARRFAHDTQGGIAIVFGLSMMVMFYCAAVAWDSSRIHNVQTSVQAALDAAALAGAKALDPDDYDVPGIKETAEAFFNAQTELLRANGVVLSNFVADPNKNERSVETSVQVRMKSYMGQLTGRNEELEFTPTSKTRMVSKKVEVALVLDVTGSMAGTRIADLKVAAKEMIDTLYSSFPQAGAIKVSLVPYSSSVNLGTYFTSQVAVTADADDTCVFEREGVNTYTNAAPVSGSRFETTGNTPSAWYSGIYTCPAVPIVPLTDLSDVTARDAFKAQIDALDVGGWTSGHLGLAWGWYTLSPEWNPVWPTDSDPKEYRDDVMKVVVLMTDGMFNTAYWNNGNAYNGSPYNSQREDPLIAGTAAYQALQLCTAIRDRAAEPHGPTIYSVSFQAPPQADALMEQCAGAGNAYTAENRATLVAAFNSIVNRLTNLAITN